jgi:hypothetical protein
MARLHDILRNGAWLTHERIRLVAVALLIASTAGFLYLVATAHGAVDFKGRPLGTDFSNVYTAGTYVNDGRAAAPFDPVQQYAREQAIFGRSTQFYGWHYPPYFLFVAAALAWMPYGLALAVWQSVTLGLYLLMIRGILASSFRGPRSASPESTATEPSARAPQTGFWTRRRPDGRCQASTMTADWLLLALAFPAVLINIGHGQNGFLTAALLGGALSMLDRRPVAAGILIGLMAYKPQYGLMIPIVLAVSARWRSFAAAAATVGLLTAVTTIVFGPQIWHAFLASTQFTRTVVLEQGNTGWQKIQSVFSWARMWGASVPVAYAIQAALIIAIGAALVWLWRSAASFPLKSAALCLATILATPYSLDYDMMVLAPAIAFIAIDGFARGFGPWQKSTLAALWLVPLVARSVAQVSLIPLGVPVMLAMFLLVLRRAELDLNLSMAFPPRDSTMATTPGGTSRGHDIAALKS